MARLQPNQCRAVLALGMFAAALDPMRAEPPEAKPLAVLGVPRLQMGQPLVFSAGGKFFLGISPDGAIVRHDSATGKVIERIRLPDEKYPEALSVDGSTCLLVSDNEFSVWDVDSKQRLLHHSVRQSPINVELSPDGKRVSLAATIGDKYTLSVWEVATGKERILSHQAALGFGFSPDGKRFIAGIRSLRCWDAVTGKSAWTTKKEPALKWTCSSDGSTLISWNGQQWRAWDMTTGQPRNELKMPTNAPNSWPRLAPDNRTLVLPTQDGTLLWDLNEGRERNRLPRTKFDAVEHHRHIGGFSPDDKSILTNFDVAQRWELESGRAMLPDLRALGHAGPASALGFSPDGRLLASGGVADSTVRIWDVAGGQIMHTLRGHSAAVSSVQFTPDGALLVSGAGDNTCRVWDATKGLEVKVLRLNDGPENARKEQVGVLRIQADGRRLTVASRLGLERRVPSCWSVWDLQQGRRLDRRPGAFDRDEIDGYINVSYRCLTPDGKALLDDQGRLVGLGGSSLSPELQKNPAEQIWDPRLSADGRYVAAQLHDKSVTGAGGVSVWELATGRPLIRLPAQAHMLAFSPSSPFLLTAEERELRVWDLRSGASVKSFGVRKPRLLNWCAMIVVSPDGRLAATAMRDGTIWLWDISVPRERAKSVNSAELAQGWADLAAPEAATAYAASLRLASAPGPTVELIGKELRPVGAPPPAERIRALVADLANRQFAKRQAAERELRRYGVTASALLKRELDANTPVEARKRIEAILAGFTDAAVPESEVLRGMRAVAVLEHIGTPEARRVLERLAGGAESARLTREARAALSNVPPVPRK